MTTTFRRDAPAAWADGVKSSKRIGVRPTGAVAGALLVVAALAALAVAGWGIKELSILWGAAAIAALAGVVVLTLRGFPLFAILTVVAGAVAWGVATRGRLPDSWFDILGVLGFIGINLAFVVPLAGSFLAALLLDARRVARLSIDEAVSGRRWWGKPDDHLPRLKELEAIPSARFFALGEGGCTHLVVAGRRVALFLPTVWPHGEYTMDAAGQVLRGGRLFVPGSEDVDGLAAEVHTWREQLTKIGGTVRGYLVIAPSRDDAGEELVISVAPGEHLHLVHAHDMSEAAGRWLSTEPYRVDLHVMERLLFLAEGNKIPEPLPSPRTFADEAPGPSTGRTPLPTDAAFAAAAGEEPSPSAGEETPATPPTTWRPGNGTMRAKLGRLARAATAKPDPLEDSPSEQDAPDTPEAALPSNFDPDDPYAPPPRDEWPPTRSQPRDGTRPPFREDARDDLRTEAWDSPRAGSRPEAWDGPRDGSRSDARGDLRTEAWDSPRAGSRAEAWDSPRDGSRSDARDGSRSDARDGSRSDARDGLRGEAWDSPRADAFRSEASTGGSDRNDFGRRPVWDRDSDSDAASSDYRRSDADRSGRGYTGSDGASSDYGRSDAGRSGRGYTGSDGASSDYGRSDAGRSSRGYTGSDAGSPGFDRSDAGRSDAARAEADASWEARATRELVGNWDNESASQIAAWAADGSAEVPTTPAPSSSSDAPRANRRGADAERPSERLSWSSTPAGDAPAADDRFRWSSAADDFPVTYETGAWSGGPSNPADEPTGARRRSWTEPEELARDSSGGADTWRPASERNSEPWTPPPAAEPKLDVWTAPASEAAPSDSWRSSYGSDRTSNGAPDRASGASPRSGSEPRTGSFAASEPWTAPPAPGRETWATTGASAAEPWTGSAAPGRESRASSPERESWTPAPSPERPASAPGRASWPPAAAPEREPRAASQREPWGASAGASERGSWAASANASEREPWAASTGASERERRDGAGPDGRRRPEDRPVAGERPSRGGGLFDGDAPELVAQPLELRRSWDSDPTGRSIRRRDRTQAGDADGPDAADYGPQTGTWPGAPNGAEPAARPGVGSGGRDRAMGDDRDRAADGGAWGGAPGLSTDHGQGPADRGAAYGERGPGFGDRGPAFGDRGAGADNGSWGSGPGARDRRPEVQYVDGRTDGPGTRDADGRTEAWPRTPERREQPTVASGRQGQFVADRGREPQFPGREDQFAADRGREPQFPGREQPQFPGREQQFPGGAQQAPGGQEESWWDAPSAEPGKPAEAAEKPKRSRWGRNKDKDAGKGKAPEVPAADDWAAGEPGDLSGWATESTSRWDRNAPRDEPGRRGPSGQPSQQGGPAPGGPGQAGLGQAGPGYAGQPSQGGPGYADRPNQGGPNPAGRPGQGEPNFGAQPGQAGPGFGGPSGQGERPGRGQDDWGGPGRSERGGQERVPEQRKREPGAFEDLAPLELNLDEEPKEKSSRRFLRRK
ncbi:MAG TPA: hypothetical protein VL738_21920 [Dactylosporangium sp.]|nr:hypothetical protein [Dactylosporangium sp.]